MQVLVIENYPDTPLGQVGSALQQAGFGWETVKAHEGDALPPDQSAHAGLVVLGGMQNARDDDRYPFLPDVCNLIRAFHSGGKPVLGICLGAQLIARAFDADNILDRPVEFGWHDVLPTEEGRQDPLGCVLEDGEPLFHWHTDSFTLPEDAVHLATSDLTPHQAFRVGRSTYGIQFHFEASSDVVAHWSQTFAEEIEACCPGWQTRLPAEMQCYADAADRAGLKLAQAWAGLLGPSLKAS